MPTDQKQDKTDLLPCSFKIHDFSAQVGEVMLQCQIMKMEGSLYLNVGNSKESVMNDLSLALLPGNEKTQAPISTKLIGSLVDETSTSIAARLAKKSGKTVYVSFNVTVDNMTLPGIEKRIHEEFKNHPELLAF